MEADGGVCSGARRGHGKRRVIARMAGAAAVEADGEGRREQCRAGLW